MEIQEMHYYEIDEEYQNKGYPRYIYFSHFDHFLSSVSTRVFKLINGQLQCVSGNISQEFLDPKETTFIILSAVPKNIHGSQYFDPGHA